MGVVLSTNLRGSKYNENVFGKRKENLLGG